MKSIRKRTRAREIAIKALYQYDALRRIGDAGSPGMQEIERFIDVEGDDPEVRGFARELVDGALASLDEIDALLARVVEHWRLERVAAMDRAILRLAAYEINARTDVPPKVSINEAIELAKKYSTAQSGAFVNGILDKLMQLRQGPESAS